MKKIITLLCALLCCFSVIFAIEPENKNTELTYEVEETYEWYVPSNTEFVELGQTQTLGSGSTAAVGVTKCLISGVSVLDISLDDAEGLNDMLLEVSGDKIPYEVKKAGEDDVLVAGDLVLSVAAGELAYEGDGSSKIQALEGKITGKPAKAGVYKDQLSFVAEVSESLVGYTWTANDVVDAKALRTALNGNYTINVNFKTNNENFIGFRVEGNNTIIRYIHSNASGDFYTVWSAGTWKSEEYKNITFTSDVDAGKREFIDWLFDNGTLKNSKANVVEVKIDAEKITNWVANQESTDWPFGDNLWGEGEDWLLEVPVIANGIEYWGISSDNAGGTLILEQKGEWTEEKYWAGAIYESGTMNPEHVGPHVMNFTIILEEGQTLEELKPAFANWLKEVGTIKYNNVEQEITDLTGYTWSLSSSLSDQQIHDILAAYNELHPENVGQLDAELYISESGMDWEWTLPLFFDNHDGEFDLYPMASSTIFNEYNNKPAERVIEWIYFDSGSLLTDSDFIKLMQDLGTLTKN